MVKLLKVDSIDSLKEHELGNFKVESSKKYATKGVTLILKHRDGHLITTSKWFINQHNELIYKIKKNHYADGKDFDHGESHIAEVYVVIND